MSRCKSAVGTLLLLATFAPATAHAQSAPTPQPPSVKVPAFEVVSIRPSKPGGMIRVGMFSSDTYFSQGLSLISILLAAYLPQSERSMDRIQNAPAWLSKEPYDIEAKLDAATMEAWKDLTPLQKMDAMRPLLQAMLAERCHLVLHTVPIQVPGYALIVAKGGPKLKQPQPGATLPSGIHLPGGGIAVPYQRGERPHMTFYSASIADLPIFFSYPGYPLHDQTGLTGHYDFVLQGRDDWDGTIGPQSSPDPSTRYQFDDLGLAIKAIKIPSLNLVIDSIDRPTEN